MSSTTEIPNMVDCDFVISANESAYYKRPDAEVAFMTTVVPIVACIGLLANLSFLFVLYRIKEMHTDINFYLGNLAAADVALLIIAGVQYIVVYINSPRFSLAFSFRANWSCAANALLGYTAYFASVFLVTMVMFERYMAICHPLKHHMIRGKGRALRMTMSAWILSFSLAIFSSFDSDAQTWCVEWLDSDTGASHVDRVPICASYPITPTMNIIILCIDFCQFILAVVATGYMIIRIIRTLSNRNISGGNSDDNSKAMAAAANKAKNQVARMLIVNATVFFVCGVPFQIHNVDYFVSLISGESIIGSPIFFKVIGWAGRSLMLLNSTVNPILYNMTNARYRQATRRAFTCSLITRSQKEVGSRSTTASVITG